MRHLIYLLEHNMIDSSALPLTEDNHELGQKIADAIGVRLDGWWEDMNAFAFTDIHDTKSSFVAKNLEDAKKKLVDMRARFSKAKKG